MNQPIRIIIADSDAEFAQTAKTVLDQEDNLQVIEMVSDGQGLVDHCREMLPDVVLMDLHLPVVDSIKAIQQMIAHNEHIRILTTSAIFNDRYALEAVKAGACGYIEKNIGAQDMINTIRQVARGEVYLNPALAASILKEFHRLAA
jgi:DNA-binding NarL/FixJ family response regulator